MKATPSSMDIDDFCEDALAGNGPGIRAYLDLYGPAYIDVQIADGKTALMLSVLSGHINTAVELLEGGAAVDKKDNGGQTALTWSAALGNRDAALLLIKNGADVNSKDNSGLSALMQAALRGHDQVVGLLLENGAAIDAQNNDGMTALRLAEQSSQNSTVRFIQDWINIRAKEERHLKEKQSSHAQKEATEDSLRKLKRIRPAKPSLKKK